MTFSQLTWAVALNISLNKIALTHPVLKQSHIRRYLRMFISVNFCELSLIRATTGFALYTTAPHIVNGTADVAPLLLDTLQSCSLWQHCLCQKQACFSSRHMSLPVILMSQVLANGIRIHPTLMMNNLMSRLQPSKGLHRYSWRSCMVAGCGRWRNGTWSVGYGMGNPWVWRAKPLPNPQNP